MTSGEMNNLQKLLCVLGISMPLIFSSCTKKNNITIPQDTPIAAVTSTITSTNTPAYLNTFTPTATPTFTNSPAYTATPIYTSTPTQTYTQTQRNTLTPTNSNTPNDTNTYTSTNTPTATNTLTQTPTLTQIITNTFTPTTTNTLTFTPTQTSTFTGTFTNTFTVTPTFTPTPLLPTAPTGLTLTNLGSGNVYLYWNPNPPEQQIIQYNVYQNGTNMYNAIYNYITITGLTTGNEYVFKTTAVNSRGESGFSNSQTITP